MLLRSWFVIEFTKDKSNEGSNGAEYDGMPLDLDLHEDDAEATAGGT